MERIGRAASMMSRGNLCIYNLMVVVVSVLISLLLFLISSLVVVFGIFLITRLIPAVLPTNGQWHDIQLLNVCFGVLAFMVGGFNIVALFRNIKLSKPKL